MALSDSLVEITLTAELEDQVEVRLGLERVEQVDDVGVRAQAAMQNEFLRLLVDGKIGASFRAGTLLGKALDGHGLVGHEILGLEDHTERSMVEGGDCLVTSTEEDTANELVLEAFHGEEGEQKRLNRKRVEKK
jgi:hypothetical protein